MSTKPYTHAMKAEVAEWFTEDQQQRDRAVALQPMQGFDSNYEAVRAAMNHRIRLRFPDANEDMLEMEVYHFLDIPF
jgi:hypothetical protein